MQNERWPPELILARASPVGWVWVGVGGAKDTRVGREARTTSIQPDTSRPHMDELEYPGRRDTGESSQPRLVPDPTTGTRRLASSLVANDSAPHGDTRSSRLHRATES